MSDARPLTLVLGGAGFIGRHVVASLVDAGVPAIVGSRDPARAGARLPLSARDLPRRAAHLERLLAPGDWRALLEGVDVVVNCVGILRERGRETYDAVHHLAPAALAAACRERDMPLLHVSALGLDGPARSGFLRSKQRGERALAASGARGAIVRPSLLDADAGGYGAVWIRRAARLPWLPLPADATGRIAALDVRDLGDAMARLVARLHHDDGGPRWRAFEFGGADPVPLAGYIARLRRATGRTPARVIPLPSWLARLGAHACDMLHVTPYSFGHWELLRRDNRPARDDLGAVLGRPPRPVGSVDAPSGLGATVPAAALVMPAGSAP